MANTHSTKQKPESPPDRRTTERGFRTGKGRTPKWSRAVREKFLDALSQLPNVARAARVVGISRSRAYALRAEDPAFAEEWEDAIALALGRNEEEIHRRAFIGYLRPIYHQGQLVGHERVYSDTLALRMQAAHDPKYRLKHEISGELNTRANVEFVAPDEYEDPGAWEEGIRKDTS